MSRRPGSNEVTIVQVAQAAGVSKAQAARAMGGYGSVSDAVKDRVLHAAEELGYRPNALARSISTGRSQSVGVVVGDVENPYFGLVTRGISDVARTYGYDVVLANTGENLAAEAKAVRMLLHKRVDGLLICPTSYHSAEHIQEAQDMGRPIVLFDRDAALPDVDCVQVCIQQSTQDLVQELVAQGHERIAYLSSLDIGGRPFEIGMDLDLSTVSQRVNGILKVLDEHGITPETTLFKFQMTSAQKISEALTEMLAMSARPTALVASDSLIALELLRELKNRELCIPADFSVVTLDDQPWLELVNPPITAVRQPAYEVGARAAQLLFHRLEGEAAGQKIWLESQVISRSSVAPVGSVGKRLFSNAD